MYGLDDNFLTTVLTILATNDRVEEAILFGSRAKGNFKPGSDIDIALKGNLLTLSDLIQLGILMDNLWTPYLFDLVLYHQITEPALSNHIDHVGQVLYRKAADVIFR